MFHNRYILIAILATFVLPKAASQEVTVVNRCSERLLIRNEGGGRGPFFLQPQGSTKLNVNRGDSRPRVWGLAGCSNEAGHGCKAPADYQSLAEFHWDNAGKIWFDVSQVDGFTLPITMTPYRQGNPVECATASCRFDLNQCPQASRIMNGGQIVACRNLNRDAETDYSRTMNMICPDAYGWSKDDIRRPSPARFSCNPDNGNGLTITFC